MHSFFLRGIVFICIYYKWLKSSTEENLHFQLNKISPKITGTHAQHTLQKISAFETRFDHTVSQEKVWIPCYSHNSKLTHESSRRYKFSEHMATHVDTAKTHQRRNGRGSWLACLPISPLGKVPGPLAESVIHDGIQSHFASPEQRLQMLEEREDEERLVVVAQSCEVKLLNGVASTRRGLLLLCPPTFLTLPGT